MSKSSLKPWPEVWQETLALRGLDVAGVSVEPDAEGWVTIKCPAHNDHEPSLRISLRHGGVRCMSRGCFGDGGRYGKNLNDLQDYVLERSVRHKGKKPDDPIGDLADDRMLPRDLLTKVFDVRNAPGGYSLAGSDPWIDPNVEDEDSKYHEDNRLFKRGRWVEPTKNKKKYHWEPPLTRTSFQLKDLVYNIYNIVGKKRIYVVAGPPDVWVMFHNNMEAVSFLGGENTPPSTRAVDRLVNRGVEEAILIYDNDVAGKEGAEKTAHVLTRLGISVTILDLPPEVGEKGDITDLWKLCQADPDKFEKALATCASRSFAADIRKRVNERNPVEALPTLPPEVWVEPFDSYRKALVNDTAASEEFHFFALMNAIGALLGRRICVSYGGDKIYPNQYTCLIGATGLSFKSTAINRARQVAEEVDTHLRQSSGSGSAEGLLEDVAFADADPEEYPVIRAAMGQTRQKKDDDGKFIDEARLYDKLHRRLLIIQEELTVLLSKAKGGGQRGGGTMIPHLLNAFDCPNEIRLPTRHNPLVIAKPTISMLAASTAEFLGAHFDEQDWYSGFGNRFVFIEAPTRPRLWDRVLDTERWADCVGYIKRTFQRFDSADDNQRPTMFTMRDDAKETLARLGRAWEQDQVKLSDAQRAATDRTHVYALKFALIFAACAEDNDNKIVAEDIALGFAVARFAEQTNRRLVNTLVADVNAQMERQILTYLRQNGAQARRDLQTRFSKWGSPKFNQLITALEEGKLIHTEEDGRWVADPVAEQEE